MSNGECGTKGGAKRGRVSTGEKLLRRRIVETIRHYSAEAERDRASADRLRTGPVAPLADEYEARAKAAEPIIDELCRAIRLDDAELPSVIVAYRERLTELCRKMAAERDASRAA